ncbi:MAG: L-seryl-tRNA(Sec) selenium transferase, partial [Vicinamibacteria bacterium]
MSALTDDVVEKAYDARLMRRLLAYLRPHRAAVLLALAALAGGGRGVAVSRGELVEIGGGFRVPDVM